MTKKFIESGPGLPAWSNPISHATVVNNMCFVSGQLSVNEQGEYVKGSIEEETKLSFQNVFSVLSAANFSRDDIAFIDIAFADLNNIDLVNAIYISLFPEGKRPARTVYEASRLPFNAKIKIVATAVKENNHA